MNTKMNILAIIQARYNSTRFPGKICEDLCGTPVLWRVVQRVRAACKTNLVAVAVPHGDKSLLRAKGTRAQGLSMLGASPLWEAPETIAPEDVLGRFVACIDDVMPTATYVIRVCGDNPLLDVESLRTLVTACEELGPDYVGYRFRDGSPAITRPTGYFAEAVWVTALRSMNDKLDKNHRWREHVTAGLYEEEGHSVDWIPVPQWYYDSQTPKFTAIDTPDDLERVRRYVSKGQTRS